jgi:chlorobactene glucosyltransferase
MTSSLLLSGMLLGIAWLWLRFAKREVSLPIWSTLELPELTEDEWPFVSIVVAAGHQSHDLGRCVQSLLRQDYSRFEVIVVAPSSSDGTWTRPLEMQASAGGGLHVLRAESSPTGSVSRPMALQRGMDLARGDWLLFTTAETYHAPSLLSRAIAYARLQGLGMLSLAPRHECRTFWSHVWQPIAFQYFAFMWPLEHVGAAARKVWACEAFLLVSREAYMKAGGHAAVASERHEGGPLMRRVKSQGYRVEFVKAMDLLQARVCRHLRELWGYWSQSLYLLLGARPLQVTAHAVVLVLWAVLPFVALIPALSFGFWGIDTMRGWWDVVFAVCAILAGVTILQAESVVRRVHRQNHFYTGTLPLGGLCLAVAAMSRVVRGALSREPSVEDMGQAGTPTMRSSRC